MVDINCITDKRVALHALAPFSEGVKELKRRSDLVDFAFSDLRLNGSKLTKEGVSNILDGNSVPGAPVLDHRLCEAHRKLLSLFDDMIHMGHETDSVMLDEFCMTLAVAEQPPYREGSPLLYHLDYVPGDEGSVRAELSELFKGARRAEKDGAYHGDFCQKASEIHMGIMKIYPYKEGFSELSARAAAQYELVSAGYFPVDMGVSESEYNRICEDAIRSGDASKFAEILRRAVYTKLNTLIEAVNRDV